VALSLPGLYEEHDQSEFSKVVDRVVSSYEQLVLELQARVADIQSVSAAGAGRSDAGIGRSATALP
jgi:hypothetical protein